MSTKRKLILKRVSVLILCILLLINMIMGNGKQNVLAAGKETKKEVTEEIAENTEQEATEEAAESTEQEATEETAENTEQEVTEEAADNTEQEVTEEAADNTEQELTEEAAESTEQEVTEEEAESTEQELTEEIVENTEQEVQNEDNSQKVQLNLSVTSSNHGSAYINENKTEVKITQGSEATVTMIPESGYYVSEINGYSIDVSSVTVNADGSNTFEVVNDMTDEDKEDKAIAIHVKFSKIEERILSSENKPEDYYSFSYNDNEQKTTIVGANGWEATGIVLEDTSEIYNYTGSVEIASDIVSINFTKMYLVKNKGTFSMNSADYIVVTTDIDAKVPSITGIDVSSNNKKLEAVDNVYISNEAITVTVSTQQNNYGDKIESVYYDNNVEDEKEALSVEVTGNKAEIVLDDKEALADTYTIWAVDKKGNESQKQELTVCIDKKADNIITLSAENTENEMWSNIQADESIITNSSLEAIVAVNQNGSSTSSVKYSTVVKADRNEADIYNADEYDDDQFKFDINAVDKDNLCNDYYIWTCDEAGNQSEEIKIRILIDMNAPQLDIKVTNDDNVIWNNPSQVVTNNGIIAEITPYELETNSSGIKLIQYGTDDTNLITIDPSADGKYRFELGRSTTVSINQTYFVKVTDNANNSTTSEINFLIDQEAPSVTITNKSKVEELTNDKVEVKVKANDNMSGVKEVWGVYKDANSKIARVTATQNSENEYSFIIDIDEGTELYSTVYVYAKDETGNVYADEDSDKVNSAASASVNIDKQSPTILSMKNLSANDSGWSNGSATIEVVVWDRNGIQSLTYTDNNNQSVLVSNDIKNNQDGSYTFIFETTKDEFNGEYYVNVLDKPGNSITNSIPVKIDTQTPQFQDCIITEKNTSTTAKVLNALSFGMFFNKEIEVDVRVTDGLISSGIAGVTLYANGEELATKEPGIWSGEEHNGEDGWTKFYIDKTTADLELSLSVTDNVGHICKSTPKEINDSLLSNIVVIDNEASSISIDTEDSYYADAQGNKWFGANQDISVKVYDELAGIQSVAIIINGQSFTEDINGKAIGDHYKEKEIKTLGDNFLVNTSQAEISEDGSYLIEVTVTDNANNVSTQSLTIYKDTTTPYIKKFEFNGNGNSEADGKPLLNGNYAYYFEGSATVTITGADKDASSGVKAITYYTVNYANDLNGITANEETVEVNSKDQITFTLPENFKGAVYAKAIDHVQNIEENFESPNGVITENAKHHKQNSGIVISLPDTDFNDANNHPLYKNDINVDVMATDIYMGIASVEWSVISENDAGNNQTGMVIVDNKKNLSGDTENWSKVSTDKNLVTSMSNTFTIQNDSNDIKVLLKLTDRAGFTTEKTVVVSIDKQAPVIEVIYDNENYDPDFVSETEYYKEARVATVIISERNFDESKVETTITNTDGTIPEISAWTESINTDDPDKSTYTATIHFEQDGDYTFDITAADKIGNQSADFEEDKFTIDLTLPIIKVEFDHNTPTNGYYYKEKRTATITIEEHNFETTRIEITGIATDGTEQITYPQAGSWSNNGDTHTATIEYVGDALYTLHVAYKDKAGNEAEPIDADEFYVDENEPEILFEGVANMSAYNDVISPIVTCTDKNINKDTVKVTVSIVKATSTSISDGSTQGNIEDISGGCRLVMNDFEHTADSDGIYTLDAEVSDKAGNVKTETITFSVNRFGSVYTLSNEVSGIAGSYVKKPIDVVITETNADNIDTNNIQIKLTKNGIPTDLMLGQDFNVTESGDDNSWKQYKYTIGAETFSEDGVYIISINSTDEAGNVNDNSNEVKKAEVWFGIDSTEPIVIPLNIEDKKSYNETQKQATISVEDNLLLDHVIIYLNGEEQQCNIDGGNYTFTIADSTKSQNVKIIAADSAGNENIRTIKDFFVTTNPIVRMIHNKTVIATVVTASTATTVGGFTLFRRRKLKLKKIIKKAIKK